MPWRTVSALVSPGAPWEPDAWHLTLCTAHPGPSTAPPGFRGEPASCPSHPYEDPSPTTSSGAARATFWDPAQSRSWPCPRANLSPAGPISPPGERRRGPGTPRPSHSTWLEDSVVQTPGQFHFLICLCSQKGGLEGSQPHPPSLALPTSAARLTGSQGGGGLNPCTWAAASLLRQVSEAAPGISRSRKRGWGGGAWPLGPRDGGRKEEPCPAAGRHCEAQRGPDKTRAGLSSGAPTQRGRLPSACSGLRAGGRARLRIGL